MAVLQAKSKKGNVSKTKDGRTWFFTDYYEDLLGNKKRYKSKKYFGKKEAQEAERIWLMTLTDKINTNDKTFKDLILEFDLYKKEKVKITSYLNYHKYYKFLSSLNNIKVCNFNIQQFNNWKVEINKADYSITYKNNIYKFLRSLLNYAIKYNNYNLSSIINKMDNFTDPNSIKKEMLFWNYEEFQTFINEETDLKYKCYFETLYYCGLRKGEANALNWNDIDLDNNTISINKNVTLKIKGEKYTLLSPKNKSSNRIIPLPKRLADDLIKLKKEYQLFDNYSDKWFAFGGVVPLPDTSVQVHRDKNCNKSGIKPIRIHDFRHSCASLLINSGASITLVAKYLGHSNITTTLNTYSHMYKNQLDEIVNIIDKL